MCRSADALAALTLRDGSDRSASPAAHPGDAALRQSGGCIPFQPGLRLTAMSRRRNTSLVVHDQGAGAGPQTFYVANIDFAAPRHRPQPQPPRRARRAP